jgi:hypothetical protein
MESIFNISRNDISLYIYWQNEKEWAGSSHLERTLSMYGYFTFIIFTLAIMLPYILPKLIFNSNRLKKSINIQKDKETITLVHFFISQLRVFLILRAVPLEASALIGLVGLFLAITDGVIYSNANYWFFLIPAILFGQKKLKSAQIPSCYWEDLNFGKFSQSTGPFSNR